jgi:hypothetical protein
VTSEEWRVTVATSSTDIAKGIEQTLATELSG